MAELNVLNVDTLGIDQVSRVLAISNNEEVVALSKEGLKPDMTGYYTKTEVDAKIAGVEVPTKTSDLTNDSGFVTEDTVDSKIDEAMGDIPTKVSELENDSNFVNKTYVDDHMVPNIVFKEGVREGQNVFIFDEEKWQEVYDAIQNETSFDITIDYSNMLIIPTYVDTYEGKIRCSFHWMNDDGDLQNITYQIQKNGLYSMENMKNNYVPTFYANLGNGSQITQFDESAFRAVWKSIQNGKGGQVIMHIDSEDRVASSAKISGSSIVATVSYWIDYENYLTVYKHTVTLNLLGTYSENYVEYNVPYYAE